MCQDIRRIMEIFAKLRSVRYVSARYVLALDLFVSWAATAVSLGILRFLSTGVPPFFYRAWFGFSLIASLAGFALMGTHRAVIRHSTLREVGRLFVAAAVKGLLLVAMSLALFPLRLGTVGLWLLCAFDLVVTLFCMVMVRAFMVAVYDWAWHNLRDRKKKLRVLVYGIDTPSTALIERLRSSHTYFPVGFLRQGRRRRGEIINNFSVYQYDSMEAIARLYSRYEIGGVIFVSRRRMREEAQELVQFNTKHGVRNLLQPSVEEWNGSIHSASAGPKAIRDVKIEDLLEREEINMDTTDFERSFSGRTVMVTGAAGSIGSELVRQLASFGVKRLVLFDIAETPMHNLRLELETRYPKLDFVPVVGDVRQKPRLDFAFRTYRPEVVFHAAAYKHVPLMEENPCEAVLVNSVGSRQVADYCLRYGVEQMVMISTDKAVNPTNIMGCSKRLAEIYVQSLGQAVETGEVEGKTKFVTTRFGNVLGSNGSVIPRFRQQIEAGGPITVTHPEITRFFMTIPEACRLVMEAAIMTDGNQIFVFDMGKSVKIADLARRMISLAGLEEGKDINIEYTGLRPGEKLYEEVLASDENTLPTRHEKIRIAKVREYNYSDAVPLMDELEQLAFRVNIPACVRLMKNAVPEFKSKNSVYEKYDAK